MHSLATGSVLKKTRTVSSSECVATSGSVIDELRRIWKEDVLAYFEILSCRYQVRMRHVRRCTFRGHLNVVRVEVFRPCLSLLKL